MAEKQSTTKKRRQSPRPSVMVNCEHCGASLKMILSHPRRYCSLACAYAARTIPPAERFWKHVRKTESCWIWISGKTPSGYGIFHLDGLDWRKIHAHRFSWELCFGPIPNGLEVCHDCPGGDNRACVNPDHLFLGTQLDNIRDMDLKGRRRPSGAKGSQISRKLTESDIPEIRRLCAQGITQTEVGKLFGITQQTVNHILRGRTWKQVPK